MDKEKRARLGGQRSLLFAASLTKEGISFVLMCGRKSLGQAAKIRSESLGPVPGTRCPGNVLIHLSALYFFLEKESN